MIPDLLYRGVGCFSFSSHSKGPPAPKVLRSDEGGREFLRFTGVLQAPPTARGRALALRAHACPPALALHAGQRLRCRRVAPEGLHVLGDAAERLSCLALRGPADAAPRAAAGSGRSAPPGGKAAARPLLLLLLTQRSSASGASYLAQLDGQNKFGRHKYSADSRIVRR